MVPLIELLQQILSLINFALLVWIILSWLVSFQVVNLSNRFVYTVYDALNRFFEPILRPIRRFMPNLGTIDISPIILFLLINFVSDLLYRVFDPRTR